LHGESPRHRLLNIPNYVSTGELSIELSVKPGLAQPDPTFLGSTFLPETGYGLV